MFAVLVGLDDDTRHHERRAAQLEEVVQSAHAVERQDAGIDVAEEPLGLVGRRHIFAVGSLDDRRGQGFLVDLLVLVERDGVDLHRGSRNHVGRLLLPDEVVEGLDVHGTVGDDVGGDVLAAVLVVEGLHGDVPDAGKLADDGLHFLELDAEAAYLHLTVLTADKLDVAVGQIAHDVAGAVNAGVFSGVSGFSGERIVDIDLGSLLGAVEIAARHLRAADPELAGGAGRQTVELLVHDVEAHVVERLADGNILLIVVQQISRREDGALGRTVSVVHVVALGRLQGRELLAAHGEVLQRTVVHIRGKLVAHLRGDERVGDAVGVEVFVEVRQVEADVFTYYIYGGAAGQRGIHIHHAGVEAVAGIGGHMTLGRQPVVALIPVAEADEVAVLQLAALGHTGRAGGVEHDEQPVRL